MQTKNCTIDFRFRGPPDSGNGGYTAGLLAKELSGDVAVMLRSPPPLNVAMDLQIEQNSVELYYEARLIASGQSTMLDLAVPPCPNAKLVQAADAAYACCSDHIQPVCFVCGPARDYADGLRIFASPVQGRDCVAGFWLPDESLDDNGYVAEEFVWAALDCPGYYAHHPKGQLMLLGTIIGSITKRPVVGQRMISLGWPIEVSGRKYLSGTALFTEQGECYASSLQTWITV